MSEQLEPNEMAIEILEALGIDSEMVTDFSIVCTSWAYPVITVNRLMDIDQHSRLVHAFERYSILKLEAQ